MYIVYSVWGFRISNAVSYFTPNIRLTLFSKGIQKVALEVKISNLANLAENTALPVSCYFLRIRPYGADFKKLKAAILPVLA